MGIVSYLIIGVIGALLGGCLFRLLHLVAYGLVGELVTATVGAVILLYVLRKILVDSQASLISATRFKVSRFIFFGCAPIGSVPVIRSLVSYFTGIGVKT